MNTYEIEIKSLLGEKTNADVLKEKLFQADPDTKLVGSSKQLNHYFLEGDMEKLQELVAPYLGDEEKAKFTHIAKEGKNFSVRTRQADNKVILVVKAAIDDTTSSNGISRIEFEAILPLSLEKLDQLLLSAGFQYQAKWSREREEYQTGNIHVCIDKNAGYGYLAEFERVINNAEDSEKVRDELRAFMGTLGVVELPQDRLERMFAYYNEHWPEYYGTDKTFTVD